MPTIQSAAKLANQAFFSFHVRVSRPFGLLIFIASLLTVRASFGAESAEVNLDYVAQRALERAKSPFHSPRADLPKVLRQDNLDYDKYREIRFRRDRALWSADQLPFRVEFFHPGYLYQEPVRVNEFTLTHTQPIRFVQDFFDYGKLDIANQIPTKTGYAGFRVLYPLNKADQLDELGAFLDSVSCAGAYEFFIKPGETTTASIRAVLYFRETNTVAAVDKNRKPSKTIGLAPLTSMFWYGKDTERKFDDYRTEVHDSDGLLVHMGNGETFFRPLDNPPATRHQVFHAPNIKGFGLLQRERNFAAYQDTFNLYHQVPSVWVEPDGNWGDGDLHLVELSTSYEGLDNIVAFWDPKNKPAPLAPFRFGYTLHWEGGDADLKRSENRVVSTRIGPDAQFAGARQFVIDFAGPKFDAIPETKPPVAVSNCSGGAHIADTFVTRNNFLGTWRVILKMIPPAGSKAAIDLRCSLQQGTNNVGETWVYQWSPP